jgi:hypothetical protein
MNQTGGVKTAADILNCMDKTSSKSLLLALEEHGTPSSAPRSGRRCSPSRTWPAMETPSPPADPPRSGHARSGPVAQDRQRQTQDRPARPACPNAPPKRSRRRSNSWAPSACATSRPPSCGHRRGPQTGEPTATSNWAEAAAERSHMKWSRTIPFRPSGASVRGVVAGAPQPRRFRRRRSGNARRQAYARGVGGGRATAGP